MIKILSSKPVSDLPRRQRREAGQTVLLVVVHQVLWDLLHAGELSCQNGTRSGAGQESRTGGAARWGRDLPLSTMRTFFHCVLPTLGVWQNRILCLSQTKMRSRTNLPTETCVRFLRVSFLHTAASSSTRLSATGCQSATEGGAEG